MINYEKKYLKYKQKYLRLKLDLLKGGYMPINQVISIPRKKTKLQQITEKVQDTTSEAVEKAKSVANNTGDFIKERSKNIYDQALNVAENVVDKINSTIKQTEEENIEENKITYNTKLEELN